MSTGVARQISNLPASERIALSKKKLQWMVDELIRLIALHENNALIFYSPLLTDQIPESFAANAFNVVQESIHRYEIVRLCTFWDGVDLEKSNVPTVIALVNDPPVIDQIVQETKAAWARIGTSYLNPDPDPVVQAKIESALRAHDEEWARKQAAEARTRLQQAISAAQSTVGSCKLTSVMNLRNKSLAHRLEETREEKRGTVAPMKFGYEKDLLEETIQIVKGLHFSINGAGFNWENSRRIARKNAKALWEGCTFDVLR